MKRMLAVAAFLLASTTAQAQYEFQYGGRTIRIDPDRGTVSIPGVYDNTVRKSKRTQDGQRKHGPRETKVDPQSTPPSPTEAATPPAALPPPAVATAPAAPPPANAAPTAAVPSATTATVEPTNNSVLPSSLPPAAQTPVTAPAPQQAVAPATQPAPAIAAVPPPPQPSASATQPQATPPIPAALRDPSSPIGVWLTEEKEGKVRIEACGAYLCGYSVDAKTNLNGEEVLINMKAGKDLKWTGRIHDPNTGSNYDSTIALKGDTLRVQGCAFGGMFCGGQTWTRVN
jgi:uncharacterized protein (DUF2147 family)